MRPARSMLLALLAALGIGLIASPLDPGLLDPDVVQSLSVQAPPPPPPLSPEEISARVDPVVVTISAARGLVGVAGTGVVLSADGTVVTNYHVIDDAEDITAVHMGNGLIYDATVAGYDRSRDVAVLTLATANGLPAADIGGSVREGDSVTAIGNASGGGVLVPAPGRVVALDQEITAQSSVDGSRNRLTDMIRIDADVRPGDSGGPLVDAWGRVVGVNAAGLSDEAREGTSTAAPQAPEAYAIPIADALAVVEQVRAGTSTGTVHVGPTAYLGVSVRDVSEFERGLGATVMDVEYGSPAEASGIVAGDVIVVFDGQVISSADDLAARMNVAAPGAQVSVEWRTTDGRNRSGVLTLG